MVSSVDEEAIYEMIEKVLEDHKAKDTLLPIAINEVARNDGRNMKILKRFLKNEVQFENALMIQLGYVKEEFNVDLVSDPRAMLQDYFDRFAITKFENPKAFGIIEKAQKNSIRSAISAMPISGTAAAYQAHLASAQTITDFFFGSASVTDALAAIDKAASMTKYAKNLRVLGGVLTVGYMGYDFYINIKNWKQGRIDGVQCSRNISSSIASVSASVACAMGGAAVAGPAGALIAGIVGGVLAAQATSSFMDLICGNDRERALNKSYEILGLTPKASNDEIRQAYLQLARQHHPDKNGGSNTYKFVEINTAYELIRVDRVGEVGGVAEAGSS